MTNTINNFSDKYFFLSNFYQRPIYVDNMVYASTEHGYQAAKAVYTKDFMAVLRCEFPGDAKRYGKRMPIREDWEDVKDGIMRSMVIAKFTQNPDLQENLLATKEAILIEGNTWQDTYWGVCEGKGLNKLGLLLMDIRDNLLRTSNF